MLNKGKVSIIVPIYKVERYIHRCLNSIIHQTYSDLEIILVNDGSPDNCGEIADSYEERDARVMVIHKENGGLSDARNYGMQEVTGEYTMFVDSDDWLAVHAVETMLSRLQKFEADIVQSAFYYAYEEKLLLDQRYFNEKDKPVIYSNIELMAALVENEKVKNFAWGKLYKTELIENIPFKKGVLFEDVYWAHQVMHHTRTYLMLHEPLYYYYQRDDSIVASSSLKSLDMIHGLISRHQFIETHYPNLTALSWKQLLKTKLIHYNLLQQNRKLDKGGLHREEIAGYIDDNHEQMKEAVRDDPHLRLQLFLFMFHPRLNLFYLYFKKVLRSLRFRRAGHGLQRVGKESPYSS